MWISDSRTVIFSFVLSGNLFRLNSNNIFFKSIYKYKQLNKYILILAGQVVKVADFGVARVQAQSGVMTAETGTYRWMAPEVAFTFFF